MKSWDQAPSFVIASCWRKPEASCNLCVWYEGERRAVSFAGKLYRERNVLGSLTLPFPYGNKASFLQSTKRHSSKTDKWGHIRYAGASLGMLDFNISPFPQGMPTGCKTVLPKLCSNSRVRLVSLGTCFGKWCPRRSYFQVKHQVSKTLTCPFRVSTMIMLKFPWEFVIKQQWFTECPL